MAIDEQLARRIVDYLNELRAVDPAAISNLAGVRVACSQGLADHPSVQVGQLGGAHAVGLIGILNGLCGADDDGWGVVAAIVEIGTGVTTGFEIIEERLGGGEGG